MAAPPADSTSPAPVSQSGVPQLTKPIVVQKFGGTSVGDPEKIRNVARIITNTVEQGYHVVAVVSAMGKNTDVLVDLAHQISDNPSGREYDALLATGEMVTTSLMAMCLQTMGYQAVGLNGGQAGVETEDLHNRARIMSIETSTMKKHLAEGRIVIVTGFQGVNSTGDITTLGRGGSDTSAVALAGALNAERCDIFTDVRGVYSTDPRIVPEAVKMNSIVYIEMLELARVGASVLHPRAVETARQFNVSLRVRSTFDLEDPGTMVVDRRALEEDRSVAGIACDKSQARVAVLQVPDQPGVAAKLFGNLAKENISVDMIIQALADDGKTNDIAFTVASTDLNQTIETLKRVSAEIGGKDVVVDDDIAKISIVGVGMIDRPGIAADMFEALSKASINIKMITTSEIKISCLVEQNKADDAIRAIHQCFFPTMESSADVMVDEKVGY